MRLADSRRWAVMAWAAGLAAAAACCGHTHAQGNPFELFEGDTLDQDFTRRDRAAFIDDLDLNAGQEAIFDILLGDYETAFREALAAHRARQVELIPELAPEVRQREREIRRQREQIEDQMRDLRRVLTDREARETALDALDDRSDALRDEGRNIDRQRERSQREDGAFDGMARLHSQWRLTKRQLREAFLADLLAVLEEAQTELWPALDRRLRREKTLGEGELAGEEVDLFEIADEADLDQSSWDLIDPILEEYSIQLDGALQARNAYLASSAVSLADAYENRSFSRALAMIDQQTALRVAVRDVNDGYAQMIIAALPEAAASAFQDAYRDEAYSRIFRTTRAARALEAAIELEGIETSMRESLASFEASYLMELAAMNERLIAMTRLHEPANIRRWAEWTVARMNGERSDRPDDPIRDLYEELDDLEDRYMEMLEGVLTEEQYRSLPGVRRRGRGR